MTTYWLTFRIHADGTYQRRYDALRSAVSDNCTSPWWVEPTSFMLFESEADIDTLAAAIADAISVQTDMVLLRVADAKTARIIGEPEDPDLFKLMPYVKKL